MKWFLILVMLLPSTLYFAYSELLIALIGGCTRAMFYGGPGWPCTFRVISAYGGTMGLALLWRLALASDRRIFWRSGALAPGFKAGFLVLVVALISHHFVYVSLSWTQPGAAFLNYFSRGIPYFLLDIYWWLLTAAVAVCMFYFGRRPSEPQQGAPADMLASRERG